MVGTDDYDPLMLDPLTAPPPDLLDMDEAGAAAFGAAAPFAQGADAPDEDTGADDLLKVGASHWAGRCLLQIRAGLRIAAFPAWSRSGLGNLLCVSCMLQVLSVMVP